MISTLRAVTSLLVSTAFLLASTGLLGTLVPVRGADFGFSETLLGALAWAYYAGFLVGIYAMPRLVRRVGHIRVFAFGTACTAMVALLHALAGWPWLWLALRFAAGIVMVGLYTIIESWLNACASATQRGAVFAIYMTVNSGAMGFAQPLLLIEGAPFVLFTVVALLALLAALPVVLTRQPQPEIQQARRLAVKRVREVAPTAAVGALLAGLALGAFFGLAPVYAKHLGFDRAQIGAYMAFGILGGALLQWPIGYASDRIDRRLMMALIGFAAFLLALGVAQAGNRPDPAMVLIFAYCGMAFAVYPMAVTHLVDYLHPDELLGASSTVYLLYGAGSAMGPLIAGIGMDQLGAQSLPYWFALNGALLALYAGYRYNAYHRELVKASKFRPLAARSVHPLPPSELAEEQTPEQTADLDTDLDAALAAIQAADH